MCGVYHRTPNPSDDHARWLVSFIRAASRRLRAGGDARASPVSVRARNATGLKNPGAFAPHAPGDTQPRDRATARATDDRARRAERCPTRLNRSAHRFRATRDAFRHVFSHRVFVVFPSRPSSARARVREEPSDGIITGARHSFAFGIPRIACRIPRSPMISSEPPRMAPNLTLR